jgi:hypothetical protein
VRSNVLAFPAREPTSQPTPGSTPQQAGRSAPVVRLNRPLPPGLAEYLEDSLQGILEELKKREHGRHCT